MSEPIILLCPGQGAQTVGQGLAWRDASPAAADLFAQADAILDGALPAPLSNLCFSGPAELLNRTDVSQPALYVTAIAGFRGLADEFKGRTIAAVAGLSLGEYTALHLAGVFSFEDGLRLVAQRGRFMQEAAEATDSSMVALIGADQQQANAVCDAARGDDVLVCANFNAPGQIVISGSSPACDRAEKVAADMGLRASRLTVAGAFHSPLMQPAADRMKAALDEVEFRPATCPVISNVTAAFHPADDPDAIRRRLVEQITSPVLWHQGCETLAATVAGQYHELPPGKVLAGLFRRINREIKVITHDTPQP